MELKEGNDEFKEHGVLRVIENIFWRVDLIEIIGWMRQGMKFRGSSIKAWEWHEKGMEVAFERHKGGSKIFVTS